MLINSFLCLKNIYSVSFKKIIKYKNKKLINKNIICKHSIFSIFEECQKNHYEHFRIMKEKTTDHILRRTWQAVARMYNEEASKYGATMALGFALLNIDKDGTPSTALAPKMGMEPTSLTRTLKSMEEKGLIVRKKNPNDGRGVIIYLTKLGLEKRELSRKTVLEFEETVKQNISQEKLNVFKEVSQTILTLIEERKKINHNEQ